MSNTAIAYSREYTSLPPYKAGRQARSEARVREPSLIDVHYDPAYGVQWFQLNAHSLPKVTPELLTEYRKKQMDLEKDIRQDLALGRAPRVNYQVLSSNNPDTFCLGGDLELFREKIRAQDRAGLRQYAETCIDLVYANVTNYGVPITTIALVQGTAMGGGFEGALSHNILIAERQAKMGLPEIMFNLFPGMGAFHLLARRIPPHQAEQLILSGRTYSAEELYDMGVIDVLAEEGRGEDAVWDYIKKTHGKAHGRNALRSAIQATQALRYDDLAKTIDIWVDAAMGLSEADLKIMDTLIRAQQRAGY